MKLEKEMFSVFTYFIFLLFLPTIALADNIKATACSQNQTDKESLNIITKDKSSLDTKGTLIVIMSAPESTKEQDKNPNRVIALKEVSYAQALEIGNKAFVFKWVANSVASFEEINALRQKSPDGKGVAPLCQPCTNGHCSNCCDIGHPCVCAGGASNCWCDCW